MLNIERYKDKVAEKMKNSDLGSSLARVFYEHCEDYGPTMAESDVLDWLLSDAPILTEKERKYLKGVIAPFMDSVICIKKVGLAGYEHICIYVKSPDIYLPVAIAFPSFETGRMYKGMELKKEYTLKDLEL